MHTLHEQKRAVVGLLKLYIHLDLSHLFYANDMCFLDPFVVNKTTCVGTVCDDFAVEHDIILCNVKNTRFPLSNSASPCTRKFGIIGVASGIIVVEGCSFR